MVGKRWIIWVGGAAMLVATGTDTLAVLGRNFGLPLIGSIEIVQAAVLVRVQPRQPIFWQVELRPLGGEIASRLAYTQKSRGQNLPERPHSIAPLHKQQCAGL